MNGWGGWAKKQAGEKKKNQKEKHKVPEIVPPIWGKPDKKYGLSKKPREKKRCVRKLSPGAFEQATQHGWVRSR